MWVPITTAWHVLTLRMEDTAPNLEGSWEYTEKAVADNDKGRFEHGNEISVSIAGGELLDYQWLLTS